MISAVLLPLVMLLYAGETSGSNVPQKSNVESRIQLEKNIRHELIMLPYYTVFDDLQFQIEDGDTVILSGKVVWPLLKDDAEDAVKDVKGVRKVINNIEILPPRPFDNDIRRREFYAIYSQIGFEKYAIQAVPPIHIIVDNGNVTLKGVVVDEYDKNAAGLVANSIPNVFKVTNDLRVLKEEKHSTRK
jgi:hyperosmotically inducible protein